MASKAPEHSLRSSHTREAIRARFQRGTSHNYLRDFIYGAIDGIVTTFAVVSAVAGAELSSKVIIILGLANLLGDGFSMAVSNFLATRAEEQVRNKKRKDENEHIEAVPDGEREEIRQIFAAKGFEGDLLEQIVEVITSDRKQWVDVMLQEEHGLSLQGPSPWRAGVMTFAAFILVGAIPLIPFFMEWGGWLTGQPIFLISTFATAAAFFCVGAFKALFIEEKWYQAGLETFFVGGCAALLSYGVGYFSRFIF